jgi:hypothetical protein
MNQTFDFRPTSEQLAALQEYANRNGRTWKSKLETDWMFARAGRPCMSDERCALLQQVRNNLGGSWLRSMACDIKPIKGSRIMKVNKFNHASRRNARMRKLFRLSLHQTFGEGELAERLERISRCIAWGPQRSANKGHRNSQWLVAYHKRYDRLPKGA